MLLVVGTDHVGADHVRALEREFAVATVSSPAAARERCRNEHCEAVVVDRPITEPEIAWLVWDLRRGEIGSEPIPTVAPADGVSDSIDVDEVVDVPVAAGDLVSAVRRAVRLREYEDALGRLFDACRREFEHRSPDLAPARERADECLHALDACDGRLPFERLIDA